MACSLFGTKPLSEPMLKYCLLEPTSKEQISMKFYLKLKKMHVKMLSAEWWPFCFGLSVISNMENESLSSMRKDFNYKYHLSE